MTSLAEVRARSNLRAKARAWRDLHSPRYANHLYRASKMNPQNDSNKRIIASGSCGSHTPPTQNRSAKNAYSSVDRRREPRVGVCTQDLQLGSNECYGVGSSGFTRVSLLVFRAARIRRAVLSTSSSNSHKQVIEAGHPAHRNEPLRFSTQVGWCN